MSAGERTEFGVPLLLVVVAAVGHALWFEIVARAGKHDLSSCGFRAWSSAVLRHPVSVESPNERMKFVVTDGTQMASMFWLDNNQLLLGRYSWKAASLAR